MQATQLYKFCGRKGFDRVWEKESQPRFRMPTLPWKWLLVERLEALWMLCVQNKMWQAQVFQSGHELCILGQKWQTSLPWLWANKCVKMKQQRRRNGTRRCAIQWRELVHALLQAMYIARKAAVVWSALFSMTGNACNFEICMVHDEVQWKLNVYLLNEHNYKRLCYRINWRVLLSASQPIKQTINQSINQSINQTVIHAINQSIKQSMESKQLSRGESWRCILAFK